MVEAETCMVFSAEKLARSVFVRTMKVLFLDVVCKVEVGENEAYFCQKPKVF